MLADSTTVNDDAAELADLSPIPPHVDTETAAPAKPVTESPVETLEITTAVADSSTEIAPTSPVETFPKTLNAIIAEGCAATGH